MTLTFHLLTQKSIFLPFVSNGHILFFKKSIFSNSDLDLPTLKSIGCFPSPNHSICIRFFSIGQGILKLSYMHPEIKILLKNTFFWTVTYWPQNRFLPFPIPLSCTSFVSIRQRILRLLSGNKILNGNKANYILIAWVNKID